MGFSQQPFYKVFSQQFDLKGFSQPFLFEGFLPRISREFFNCFLRVVLVISGNF